MQKAGSKEPVILFAKLIMAINPRYENGNLRRKMRKRLRAMGCECGICHGRYGPIHYDEPSDSKHPLSFVIDEIHPISKWKQYGYQSPAAAAQDWNNVQAAHYYCNSIKSNHTGVDLSKDVQTEKIKAKLNVTDGEW